LVSLAPPRAGAQQYAFEYFGVENGLSNLTVKALFQDRTGFIWVATENGLFRYEGARFREFSPEQGLPSSVTASIGEAPDGSVLVGNQSGLFHLRGERFERIPILSATKVNGYNGLARDGQRTLIATDVGILEARSEPGGAITVAPGPPSPDPAQAEAQSVWVDGKSLAWGCGLKLCRLTPTGMKVYGTSEGLLRERVISITRDGQKNLWVQQNRRLFVMWNGASTFQEADPSLPPTGPGSRLQVDMDGRLLVPTTEGLAIREGGKFHLVGRASGVLPPVYSVLQDREGSVWLGLAGRGVARWLGYGEWESFSAQSGLSSETIYEILPIPGGDVWVGTESGFFRGTKTASSWEWRQQKSVESTPVHAVRQAADGMLWLGSDGKGVGKFDPRSGKVRWYDSADGLGGRSPYTVMIDRKQNIWAGTEKGIFVLAPGSKRFEGIEGATKIRCWALLEAPDGDIWAGTADGIWWLDGTAQGGPLQTANWKRFGIEDGLIGKSVIALAMSARGELWIGYRLSGSITRLIPARPSGPKSNSIAHFEPPQGRQANITYFLNFDPKGNLWAGTNLGVLVRSPNATKWDRYDRRDGLIWDDCDLHAFAAEADGHVWIGTSGGLSRFIRRTELTQQAPPRTVFTSALYGNTPLDFGLSTRVKYASDPLNVRFTALRFGHDRDVIFRYRIDPLDQTARETSERLLQIAALQPGAYTLTIAARESSGQQVGEPAVLRFQILPPWWRTWWFLLGSAAMVAFLISFLFHQRTRRQQAIRRALETAVAERTHELAHQYRHDVLTGLPNRLLFGERLNRELRIAAGDRERVAVLFIDVDRFKRINDTWGHQAGDNFLRQIAERLSRGLRPGEMIGRIGGDEFIVLIPRLRGREEASSRGQALLDTLQTPIHIEDKNVFATMSIGVATYPDDALSPDALMAAADAAMYSAKAAGKNQVQLFRSGMMEAASRPQNIEDKLRDALRTNGFRLVYQPQYTITGLLVGFEALLRVDGAERDLSPGEFIPIAEESGLIVEIGAWVLREACRQTREWNVSGFPTAHISVNVSVMQLAHAGFEQYVLDILQETGLEPARLELELTETALVKDTGNSAAVLNRLRSKGIQIALDDFGTGYSPMQYLHQLPVDIVKIDQVFVRDLDDEPSSLPLVEGMVKLARTLSLKVVAEGVETEEQFEILRRAGFDVAQGNLFSVPVCPDKAVRLLAAGTSEGARLVTSG
jgi:diguanylate cyclase (GGDEF)-like protein